MTQEFLMTQLRVPHGTVRYFSVGMPQLKKTPGQIVQVGQQMLSQFTPPTQQQAVLQLLHHPLHPLPAQ